MNKKYLVRLSDEERSTCQEVIKKLKGSSQKVRRAQILLKADAVRWTPLARPKSDDSLLLSRQPSLAVVAR
jgi:hypothetical protein